MPYSWAHHFMFTISLKYINTGILYKYPSTDIVEVDKLDKSFTKNLKLTMLKLILIERYLASLSLVYDLAWLS